jgi:prepilin-type N-terminal cleavage/methylation domain-containing protein
MHRRDKQSRGFSLIEAAVAIGVIAILAAAAAPLVMKALNQQREQRARNEMKLAFETFLGSRERTIPNIRSDFGFELTSGASAYLGKMLDRTAPPAPNALGYNYNGASFLWGWNGPYWNGQTKRIGGFNLPVDPWGNPYLIRYVSGASPGYQILCTGLNGINNTAINSAARQGDDFVYPTIPVPTNAVSGTVNVQVTNQSGNSLSNVRVAVRWKQVSALSSATTGLGVQDTPTLANNASTLPLIVPNLPTGTFQITVLYPFTGPTITSQQTYVYDLAPGQSLTVQLFL